MSTSLHRLLTFVLALTLLTAPAAKSLTQAAEDGGIQIQPVVVVSITNSDKLLGDVGFLTEVAGAGDVGRLVTLMAAPYTAGLDKSKPAGAYLTATDIEQADVVGFVGVKDLDLLLGVLQDQLGQPRDAGDGVQELATDRPQSVFVKEANGWAFFAYRKSLLQNLPRNPGKLLGDMPKNYTLAVRVNVANMPTDLRRQAVEQMRRGFEEGLENQVRDGRQAEVARQLGESWLDSMVALVEETDHLTVGWQVDATNKSTYLDVNVTAQRRTQLAKDMAQVRERSSAFAGMLHPNSAAAFLVTAPYTESDIKQTLALIELAREEAMKGIDADEKLANDGEKDQAKKIIGDFLDLAVSTAEAAKMDAGGCLVLKPEAMTAVVGGFVSDGDKLAATVQSLHAFAKSKESRTPNVNFNAETHGGVTLHTASIPLPGNAEPNARKTLGDPMDVVIGTGKASVYLAFGKNARATLVEILDASAQQAEQLQPPVQSYVALTPILEFAASVDDNPVINTLLLNATEGKDRISLSVLPAKRGVTMRVGLDAGVITMIGESVRELAPLMQNLRQ